MKKERRIVRSQPMEFYQTVDERSRKTLIAPLIGILKAAWSLSPPPVIFGELYFLIAVSM